MPPITVLRKEKADIHQFLGINFGTTKKTSFNLPSQYRKIIDDLVEKGYYPNNSDFIVEAVKQKILEMILFDKTLHEVVDMADMKDKTDSILAGLGFETEMI